jgi:hypothetical protein
MLTKPTSMLECSKLYRAFCSLPVNHDAPQTLEEACADLVALKDRFDKFMQSQRPSEGPWGELWSSPPDIFVRAAFLRMSGWQQIGPDRIEEIPSHLVIGGRYKTYDEVDDPVRLMASLNASGSSILYRLGPLPLYYAYEGKNRVEVFKRYRMPIRAWVRQIDFPPPGAMLLQPDIFLHQAVWWGGGKALLFPDVTLPILRFFGLAEERRYPRLAYAGHAAALRMLFGFRLRR